MKNLILVLAFITSTQAFSQESYFANTNAEAQTTSSNPQEQDAHKILALLARMSVFSLICGQTPENNRFSALYRSIFTEKNRGMVQYNSITFLNPIEGMRNRAMLHFSRNQTSLGGAKETICSHYNAEFRNFLFMTSSQILQYTRLNPQQQSSYLQAVNAVEDQPAAATEEAAEDNE